MREARTEFVATLELVGPVLQQLEQKVRDFGPEQILKPEVAEEIRSDYESILDAIATSVLDASEQTGLPPEEIYTAQQIALNDFVRAMLTPPLPLSEEQCEEEGMPYLLDSWVADHTNWWERLSAEQKSAFSNILGIDLFQADKFVPASIEEYQVIYKSDQLIKIPAALGLPATSFYPVLVCDWYRGPALTCIPVVNSD